jgi:hypothetical protein
MTDEPEKVEEAKEKENVKAELEEMRTKANEEFSSETENQTPPQVVERINQILNDAIASQPVDPIEPPPKVDPIEKARKQIADALAQMNVSEEVAGKVTGIVGAPEGVETAKAAEPPPPEPWKEPAPPPAV